MSLIQFKELLNAKPEGLFFLQNELSEYTSPEELIRIIQRVTRTHTDFVKLNGRSYCPHFSFSIVGEKLRITITEKQIMRESNIAGHIDLISKTFGSDNTRILCLDKELSVCHTEISNTILTIMSINTIEKSKAISLFEEVISENPEAYMKQPIGKSVYQITEDEVVVFANAIKKFVLDTKIDNCFPECSNTYQAMEINNATEPYKKRIAELELLLNIRATM